MKQTTKTKPAPSVAALPSSQLSNFSVQFDITAGMLDQACMSPFDCWPEQIRHFASALPGTKSNPEI